MNKFIAGKHVINGKIAKIVGLDPASPLFSFNEIKNRLDATDAEYVEIIHTCAGTLGFSQPLGTLLGSSNFELRLLNFYYSIYLIDRKKKIFP